MASSPGDALALSASEWAVRFRAQLGVDWNPEQIEQLHEDLDRLAVESDAAGRDALSQAAVELSVYLCSFVGPGRWPEPAQRAQLETLTAALVSSARAAAPVAVDAQSARVASSGEPQRNVLLISEDAGLVAALSDGLAERGISLTARAPGLDPAAYVPEIGVQCVVFDVGTTGVMAGLARNPAAMTGRNTIRPTFVALIGGPDTAARLHAMRSGADHVVAYSGDSEALLRRLVEILSARSEEPLRVLLIDDDRAHTAFCESILRRFGMETIVCSEPERAVALFAERKPDVVLLDIYMPGVDGLAISESLLELQGSQYTSILFLSGDAEPETRFDALAAGGDDFLSKPIAPRHLIRAVAAHGRRAQRRRRLAT